MTFRSILFPNTGDCIPNEGLSAPDFFFDLNLDQIIDAITAGKTEYDLKSFFYMPLQDAEAITWRHEIMQDLDATPLLDNIKAFAQRMRAMREHLAQSGKMSCKLQKERWFLDAADIYCDVVTRLAHDLSVAEPRSRGLLAFRKYVTLYAGSDSFTSLFQRTKKLIADLSAIHYTVLMNGLRVEVRHYGGEPDYASEVTATFEIFRQGAAKEYSFNFIDSPQMNSVEERIVALVALLHPDIFSALEQYCAENKDFQDRTIVTFDREIQFYVAYLEHTARVRNAGLKFCYPRVIRASKEVRSVQGFDLALANNLIAEGGNVVCNDFHLKDGERIIVVSGPNQGGKTTFARTFGQLHYLASLGCPVPGTHAQLFLFDRLFTHFEKEENLKDLRGKLQDDLVRIHQILERATPNSIIVMNEVFMSTTLRDAVALSRKIADKIMALDLLCVWVTFIDELASLNEKTVSMVSTVVPENPALRTFKIVRRPADGLAYAMCIAEKHRLTYSMIKERIGS
ncbi:MAG: DNA mismatch repair protein MutS [Deltaproteobacteria bacterium]|nr:DNA mismatch repair protein MutS [Deltaproteobacteria bacterium]